uniref:Protein YIPF n=1 Tax=Propithecus coquereli TaxID=379532 RepID=A0A2K6GG39_PROCO
MAEAAESPGDPGTASPRPLVSLGSATKGTEGEARVPPKEVRGRARDLRDLLLIHLLSCLVGDLWGPLILCVTLALMLQRGSADSEKDGGPQFAEVFVIVWFGAVTITLNSKLLGGNISFFQSLCVLGYCILPLTVAMLICRLVLLAKPGPVNFMVRLIVVIAMFAWSIVASTAFLADSQPPNRKALAVYPVFLFYFVISWMILTFTP